MRVNIYCNYNTVSVQMTSIKPDELISMGFNKETALNFIASFVKYINENTYPISALCILYNSENMVITHDKLVGLQDKLRATNAQFIPYRL